MDNKTLMNCTPQEVLDVALQQELDRLRCEGLHRDLRYTSGRQGSRMTINGQEVLMLAGANYLDLAGDPRVIQAAAEATEQLGCAAGGARLISGNLLLHESLEQELAQFAGRDAALLFSTGYVANLGVITTLAGPDDVIVSDSLNHASIIDACRLSRAETRVFRHNDLEDFGRVVKGLSGFRRRLLIVDGVFSMDGDVAQLGQLVPMAREHDMITVVDDAHGFGILGTQGRGSAEYQGEEVDIQIGNLGKALGSFGAFVACSAKLREYLINCCRTFIFTCGLPPSAVGAARASLKILSEEPQRRRILLDRANQLRTGLKNAGYQTGQSRTHILPVIVGDNERTMRLCERALERGVYAQGIRYPSVPDGTARLRFTPMCSHTPAEIESVIRVFHELRNET